MSTPYDDFERTLLRAGKNAEAPMTRMRERAMQTVALASLGTVTAAASPPSGLMVKSGALGKLWNFLAAFKWTIAGTLGAVSASALVCVHTYAPASKLSSSGPVPHSALAARSPNAIQAPMAVPLTEEVDSGVAPNLAFRLPQPRKVKAAFGPSALPDAKEPREPPSTGTQASFLTPTRPSLRDEITLMDAAREALARRDTGLAVQWLEDHARRFPNGTLWEERELLRVRVATAIGKTP